MSDNEQVYLRLLEAVLSEGKPTVDRTGVGTLRIFGPQLRFDLQSGFPLMTSKQVSFRKILSELLWFIEGSGDNNRLAQIEYGEDHPNLDSKTTIWTENAESPYWRPKAKSDGDLGRIYGVQWRSWRKPVLHADGSWGVVEIDQMARLIETIKTNPSDRRLIVSAWNPGELDEMALPPCHRDVQFFVDDGELSAMMSLRSSDVFLGLPFNIASYALLTMMIGQVCKLKPKSLIMNLGDTHIYANHIDQVKQQLGNPVHPAPKVEIDPTVDDIDGFRMDHFRLMGYKHSGKIAAAMAV